MIAINTEFRKTVKDFIFSTFPMMEVRRKRSVCNAILGIVDSESISVSDVGRSIAKLADITDRSGIKQFNKLLSNKFLDYNEIVYDWARYLLNDIDDIFINVDWTDFQSDDHAVISASIQTKANRSISLFHKTVTKSELKGKMNDIEDEIINDIEYALNGRKATITIVVDRGFADGKFMLMLERLFEYGYVVRIKSNFWVTKSNGERIQVLDLAPKGGELLVLSDCLIKDNLIPVKRLAVAEERRKSDKSKFGIFCVVSNREDIDIQEVYSHRFSCEETFRDIKDPTKFGLGMSSIWCKSESRRDRMWLLASISLYIVECLAKSAEDIGASKRFRHSGNKNRRSFSLRTLGFRVYKVLIAHKSKFNPKILVRFLATRLTRFRQSELIQYG